MLQVYETLVRGSPLKNDGYETICFVKLIIDNFWCRNICIVSTQIGCALLSAADFLGFTKLFVSSPSHPLISAIICNRGKCHYCLLKTTRNRSSEKTNSSSFTIYVKYCNCGKSSSMISRSHCKFRVINDKWNWLSTRDMKRCDAW